MAIAVAVTAWITRYQPFGPGGPIGTPVGSNEPEAAGWIAGPEAPFARLEMATAASDGRIWMAGGFAPDGATVDAVAILDPATGEWSEGPPLPEAVNHAALAFDGERLWLVGGYLATGEPTAAVRVLEIGSGTWTDGPSLPQPRAAGAIAFDGRRLVYAGGVGPGGVRAEVFALDDGAWEQIGDLARPREHLAAATDGAGRTWFLGGRQGGLDRNVGDVEVAVGSTVELVATLTPRGGVAAFYAPELGGCLTGGEAPSGAIDLVECVDLDRRVTALPSMTQARHGHGAAVVGSTVYLLLGGDQPGLDATSTTETLAVGD